MAMLRIKNMSPGPELVNSAGTRRLSEHVRNITGGDWMCARRAKLGAWRERVFASKWRRPSRSRCMSEAKTTSRAVARLLAILQGFTAFVPTSRGAGVALVRRGHPDLSVPPDNSVGAMGKRAVYCASVAPQ